MVEFSEPVAAFVQSELTHSGNLGSTITNWVPQPGGRNYTATVTPTTDGNAVFDVAENVAQDAANNGNTAAAQRSVSVDLPTVVKPPRDTERPSVRINVPAGLQNGVFNVTVEFSETVVGFLQSDLSASGNSSPSITNWVPRLDGRGYDAAVTPISDGVAVFNVPSNTAQDAAGNWNRAAAQQSVTVDVSAPTVTIAGVPTTVQTDPFDVTITFSEVVTGFAASDIALTGTADAAVTLTGSGRLYAAAIVPSGEGTLGIQVPAGVAKDAAKNGNIASVRNTMEIDAVAPTVTIDVPSNMQTYEFDVTVTFSEEVIGFTASDIEFTGAVNEAVTVIGSGAAYTATVTPVGAGTLGIQIPAGIAHDAANNGNAESRRYTVEIDTVAPTITIDVPLTVQTFEFDVTITFSERVIGFAASDIEFSGSVGTVATVTGSGAAYTATVTPTGEGTLTIHVPMNVALDAANNGNKASMRHTVEIDTVVPDVTIDVPTEVQTGNFDVTITFSEAVTGFTADDLALDGTVDGAAALTGGGAVYTANVTPNGEGTLGILVPAGVARDAANNGNTISERQVIQIDTVAPVPTIAVPLDTQGAAFDVTVTFSEPISGFEKSGLSVSGAGAVVTAFEGSGADYNATILPVESGTVTLNIAAGVARDTAGNPKRNRPYRCA